MNIWEEVTNRVRGTRVGETHTRRVRRMGREEEHRRHLQRAEAGASHASIAMIRH